MEIADELIWCPPFVTPIHTLTSHRRNGHQDTRPKSYKLYKLLLSSSTYSEYLQATLCGVHLSSRRPDEAAVHTAHSASCWKLSVWSLCAAWHIFITCTVYDKSKLNCGTALWLLFAICGRALGHLLVAISLGHFLLQSVCLSAVRYDCVRIRSSGIG